MDERTSSSPDRFNSANLYRDGSKKGRKVKLQEKADDEYEAAKEAAYDPTTERELFEFWHTIFRLQKQLRELEIPFTEHPDEEHIGQITPLQVKVS